ncbi:MAG: Rieske 2Fe-2S domain-containing protein [Gammaproteobacteria bacterium]
MSWKRLCAVSDLAPNKLVRFEVDGVPIVAVNLGDGEFRAVPPACPHMEEPLDQSGVCKDGVLTCTKHLWQWDLRSGQGHAPDENDRRMLRYELRREGDDLYVELEAELEYEYEEEDDDDFEW